MTSKTVEVNEVVEEEFDPLAGDFDESSSTQIEWLKLSSDISNGEYLFVFGLGNPSTNNDRNRVTYAGNDALKIEQCALFSSDEKFVAKWLYTRCEDDPGFALGLDKRSNVKYGGFYPFPQVSVTFPVLWDISLNENEDWDGESGTLVNLSVSEAQFKAILALCGTGKKKNANKHQKILKIIKNDKAKTGAEYYTWEMFDDENACDVSVFLGEEFSFATMLKNERNNILKQAYHGVGTKGAEAVWLMLEETIGQPRDKIIANPFYNQTSDVVSETAVNEVDLSLDT